MSPTYLQAVVMQAIQDLLTEYAVTGWYVAAEDEEHIRILDSLGNRVAVGWTRAWLLMKVREKLAEQGYEPGGPEPVVAKLTNPDGDALARLRPT